ncbi:MAG: glycosyltransferase family 4 protein [Anaerolineales bacterium]|nr:glycosyltransferase family 4 protein [Anaerolineales bacterium]
MRLLFLSNFYPPASRGGFEQWCQEVAEGLRARGHEVQVLTSAYGRTRAKIADLDGVHRDLHLEMELASLRNAFQFFTHRKKKERENLSQVRALLKQFQPQAVLIWGMWNLQRSIPALVEKRMPDRVVYYMGDYWPTLPDQFENYWNAAPRNALRSLPKLLLKPLALRHLAREPRTPLKLENVLFPSQFMQADFQQKGLLPQHSKVIYGAIDTKPYNHSHPNAQSKLSLLYIGRLSREKGVHTAIEAVALLVREHGLRNFHLTIVGDGEPEYAARLQILILDENLASFVDLLPAQPKEALPALYQQADIFLFTSIWAEPFGRVIVEAMASGVAVIGTRVGGAAELLLENALAFQPDDAADLAQQIKQLIESPELRHRLAKQGQAYALKKFDLQRMTSEIEDHLQALTDA